jgi:polynucleotide 5'-kinase involved in rRNA processing
MNSSQTKLVSLRSGKSYDVYIGRPSIFGNPYTHIKDKNTLAEYIVSNRNEAIQKYEEYILNNQDLLEEIYKLEGKILACWCHEKKCHGDIIIKLIEEHSKKLKIKPLF